MTTKPVRRVLRLRKVNENTWRPPVGVRITSRDGHNLEPLGPRRRANISGAFSSSAAGLCECPLSRGLC